MIVAQNLRLPTDMAREPFWKPLECLHWKRIGLNSRVLRFSSPSSSSSV